MLSTDIKLLSRQKKPHWRRSGVFIVNFEHISNIVLVSIVDFEQVKTDQVASCYFRQKMNYDHWENSY